MADTSDLRRAMKFLHPELDSLVGKARVLVVGAGGIGCELLKNIVYMGFNDIHVIDLDTIEVSNLNRQFLFRKVHVGQSKATVARAAVMGFRGNAEGEKSGGESDSLRIVAHHGDIKGDGFGLSYFSQFDVVMNALDNISARRHVNRLCLAAGKPLIESGTQGYLGQVTVHLGGQTECFDCVPHPTPKTFAVCTLRNTPDRPIHCIVWAKHLHSVLFGPEDTENVLADMRTQKGGNETCSQFADRMLFKFFHRDIETQLAAKSAGNEKPACNGGGDGDKCNKKGGAAEEDDGEVSSSGGSGSSSSSRGSGSGGSGESGKPSTKKLPPIPLVDVSQLAPYFDSYSDSDSNSNSDPETEAIIEKEENALLSSLRARELATTSQLIAMFRRAVRGLVSARANDGPLTFDKDRDVDMDFVFAAANLRMINFHIPNLSRFETQGIAGNIVHAIATTNAIAAGIILHHALRILAGSSKQCRTVWISKIAPKPLMPQETEGPNPECLVCGKKQMVVTTDVNKLTVRNLYDAIKQEFAFNVPILTWEGGFVDDEVLEDQDDPTPGKTLFAAKIKDGGSIGIQDMTQELMVTLVIAHGELNPDLYPKGYVVGVPDGKGGSTTTTSIAPPPTSQPSSNGDNASSSTTTTAAAAAEDDDDDIIEEVDPNSTTTVGGAATTSVDEADPKRRKVD